VGLRVGQEGCVKSCPTPTLCPQTVQHVMRCYSNCGIMALLDVVTGAVFIVNAFNDGNIFLSLRITLLSNFSPLSAHNTLSPTAQFLPSLSTQHSIAHRSISPLSHHTTLYRAPLNFSPLSAHNTVYLHSAEFCVLLNTQLLQLVLQFACCDVHFFFSQAWSTFVM